MGRFFVLKGLPATGKSTLGDALGRALQGQCAVLSKDDARDFMVGYDARVRDACVCAARLASAAQHDAEANALCYDIVLHIAEKQLKYGLDVVFDSPLGRVGLMERCVQIADRLAGSGVRLVLVDCQLEDQEWLLRLRKRAMLCPQDHRMNDPEQIRNYYLSSQFEIPSHLATIRCDMTRPPHVLAAQILSSEHCKTP
ncbi:hypothetical protein FVE85_4465 [Porphyridium purpureum]|uniref:Uncharacterized protein n=1 Tax=Porphyridium purpureum TaxID=35688 RepID=A0A5J4YID7_PORPP|nr:hypothetical protein FVE85_4465 [Porphyridium purpureum]|eukprot:POR4607..scf297_16